MKRSIGLFSAIFIFLFSSCTNDAEKIKTGLPGYWTVDQAFRDKKETQLLAGVYFEFGIDGKMETNLPNISDTPTDYEVLEHSIVQKTSDPVTYQVLQVPDSTMVLSMVIRNTTFDIHLKRGEKPLPVEEELDLEPETEDQLQ